MTAYRKMAGVARTTWQLLLFKPVVPDLKRLGPHFLGFGLLCAWLAGVGRYWDNPRAGLWQHLGLGSVAYVFVMAMILFLVVKPLRPANWSYRAVLTFVALTSPPALIYAIPVEKFMSMANAQLANLVFLLVVASWRVGLLLTFLRRSARLSGWTAVVATTLPITIIIVALTFLNLERAVFEIMGGLADEQTSADSAYAAMVLLTIVGLATFFLPILLVAYAAIALRQRRLHAAPAAPG